jgi:hypothetical protein
MFEQEQNRVLNRESAVAYSGTATAVQQSRVAIEYGALQGELGALNEDILELRHRLACVLAPSEPQPENPTAQAVGHSVSDLTLSVIGDTARVRDLRTAVKDILDRLEV